VPAWKVFWTVFGSSNQLLASLVLFGISLWLFRNRMRFRVALIPSLFMSCVTILSFFYILKPWMARMISQRAFVFDAIGITSLVLVLLAFLMLFEGGRIFLKAGRETKSE